MIIKIDYYTKIAEIHPGAYHYMLGTLILVMSSCISWNQYSYPYIGIHGASLNYLYHISEAHFMHSHI